LDSSSVTIEISIEIVVSSQEISHLLEASSNNDTCLSVLEDISLPLETNGGTPYE
jgi:hypothetical protein